MEGQQGSPWHSGGSVGGSRSRSSARARCSWPWRARRGAGDRRPHPGQGPPGRPRPGDPAGRGHLALLRGARAGSSRPMLADPPLRRWFKGYPEYRRPLASDRGLPGRAAPASRRWSRPTRPSSPAFFATDSTGEYFRRTAGSSALGYNPQERWWWAEAIARAASTCAAGRRCRHRRPRSPWRPPVRRPDGTLLGVGGIDVAGRTPSARLVAEPSPTTAPATPSWSTRTGRIIYFPGRLRAERPKGSTASPRRSPSSTTSSGHPGLRRPGAS